MTATATSAPFALWPAGFPQVHFPKASLITIAVTLTALIVAASPRLSAAQSHSFFTVKNAGSNRCLNVHSGLDNREGGRATVYSCEDTLDQEWELTELRGGWNHLRNRSTGLCLRIDRASENKEGGVVTVGDCRTTADQQWKKIATGVGGTQLQNRGTQRCLNVHGGLDNRDGGGVTSYTCADTPDQKWAVTKINNLVASCGAPERFAGGRVWLPKCVRQDFSYGGSQKKLTLYYTETSINPLDILYAADTDGDGRKDLSPAEIAARIAPMYETAWKTYLRYGFPDPNGREELDVHLIEMGKPGWCCHVPSGQPPDTELSANSSWRSFDDDSDALSDVRDLKSIVYHEMWHASEAGLGIVAQSEGLAELMSDQVSLDVDNFPGSRFFNMTSAYLAGLYQQPLDIHDYVGALWWKYFAEQLGDAQEEPRAGTDAILRAYDHRQPLSNAALNQAIGRYIPDTNLEDVWANFTVANIAKDFESTARMPPRYRYRDAIQPGAPSYIRVRDLELSTLLNANQNLTGRRRMTVRPWSAQYLVVKPSQDFSKLDIDFEQTTDRRLTYTTLVLADGKMSESRVTGKNLKRTLEKVGGSTVIVVVTGLPGESDARLNYQFVAKN